MESRDGHQGLESPPRAFGALLQYWRKTRNLSQLALAHEADVSPRHVCFVETGRAKPSREMVIGAAPAHRELGGRGRGADPSRAA
jgi:transcriptional regulator with XRE-family HTH domain